MEFGTWNVGKHLLRPQLPTSNMTKSTSGDIIYWIPIPNVRRGQFILIRFQMSSVLSNFFSRDPRSNFPHELPSESFTTIQQNIFVGNSFKKADPADKSTCFWSTSPSSSLRAQAQKLKTLRHPNVLAYLDSLEVDGNFYLITEQCRPLGYYLNATKLNETQRELLVSWGLYQVMSCLKFLHNEAKTSHNNLMNAIFVTSSGDWKLAAFNQTSAISSPQTDLNDLGSILCRIFDVASGQQLPKRLQSLYKRLNSRGKSIMTVSDILNESRSVGGFMKNKFVDTLLFLDEFQIRDAAEKQSFFMQLNSNLDLFPDDISKNKILPKLIHTYEYGDAGAHILIPMFKLGRLLEEDEYQQKVVPCLVKLFNSTDRTTRVKLLERIDEFSGHLKPQVVNEKIYGNIVTGFLDSNSAVRESTVKAMVALADRLNHHNLNTDLMKYLARLQGNFTVCRNHICQSTAGSDPEPSIRTNATICLGKIGCYIDPGHRQRILISAFTRALKDPFPPARMAGIIALSATQQYFSLAEVAHKVLPTLAPLAVDPEKQVRDQSFKAMSGFLEKLQKASDNPQLIPELEAQVNAGGRGGLLSGEKVPQWAGWAIKAISGKFYKASANATANNNSGQQQHNVTGKEDSVEESPKRRQQENKEVGALPRVGSFSSTHSSTSAKGTSSSVTDGWGELVDEEEQGEKANNSEGSDYGGVGDEQGGQSREDALWGAAMDEWEARGATPSPRATPNRLNAGAPSAPEKKHVSPAIVKKGTTSLKLGTLKAAPMAKANNPDPIELLLGGGKTTGGNARNMSAAGKAGNFVGAGNNSILKIATVGKAEEPKKKEEKATNDWQDW